MVDNRPSDWKWKCSHCGYVKQTEKVEIKKTLLVPFIVSRDAQHTCSQLTIVMHMLHPVSSLVGIFWYVL